jgi:serine/threonine protein kinase
MDLRPGDIVYGETEDERYEVIRMLGSGAFGIVYEVQSNEGQRFALKTIVTALLDDTTLQILKNEGRLATEIDDENVLNIFYFHDGVAYPQFPPYMLMEFADGGTLEQLIDEKRKLQEQFSADELRPLLLQLASGMKAVNEKLVHRDIKPDNILLVSYVLKIADFGLSKIVGAATRSKTFKGINHLKYCAPEALRLDENTPSMDIYSMGIVFYELSTLKYPYQIETAGDIWQVFRNAHLIQIPVEPDTYNPSLELGLIQLILKMISKRPQDRYSSWNEVIERLQRPEDPSEKSRNVSSLVERALDSHRKAEKARLEAEEKARKEKEYNDLVKYCFDEIAQAGQEIVNAFNEASDFAELEFKRDTRFSFVIYEEGHRLRAPGISKSVRVEIKPIYDTHKLKDRAIRAWGHAKAPSGRGFNLLLVATDPDDLYGQWITFHVSHNPIARRRDPRPEPFPFEFKELPQEIHHLGALHIYQPKQGLFKAEILNPLIEELI